jgi:nucleoside-diphosphate-sugar epimerase
MRVAVTGAGGFLGRALVDGLIEAGHVPLAIVKRDEAAAQYRGRKIDALARDLSTEEECADIFKDCDALVHCAALTSDFGRWDDFRKFNIDATHNVMETADAAGLEKIVHISTTAIYGNERNHFATDEEEDFGQRVVDPYSRSKIAADEIVIDCMEYKNLPASILRLGNIWGPGDRNVLPFVVNGLRGKWLRIEGDGDNILSLTFIDNAVKAILLALENPCSTGKIYNVTDGTRVTSKKFIEDVIGVLGIKYKLRNIPYPLLYSMAYFLERYYLFTRRQTKPPLTRFAARILKYQASFDISRAINELQYRPRVSYKEALAISTPYIRSLYFGPK